MPTFGVGGPGIAGGLDGFLDSRLVVWTGVVAAIENKETCLCWDEQHVFFYQKTTCKMYDV